MKRGAVVLLLLLAGCPGAPADGELACGTKPAHPCPDGYSCIEGRCYLRGHVFDSGAGVSDDMTSELVDLGVPPDLATEADLEVTPDLALRSTIDEQFSGPDIDRSIWETRGSVAIVDDTSSGAASAAKVMGALLSHPVRLDGDFTLHARMRVSVSSNTTIRFGLLDGTAAAAFEVMPGGTAWAVLIGTATVTPTAMVPIGSGYSLFEMKRAGANLTLLIDGTTVYAQTGPDLAGNEIRADITGPGAIYMDKVTFTVP